MAVFLGGGFWSPPLFYLGILMALVGLALAPAASGRLVREPITWWVALLVIWVIIRGWLGADSTTTPDVAAGRIWNHVRYSAIVPLILGCWLARWWHRRLAFMAILCVGLLAYYANHWYDILIRLPIGDAISVGNDLKLGLISATATALVTGLVFSFWRARATYRGSAGRNLLGLVLATGIISTAVLVFSYDRKSWLAIAFGLIVLSLIAARSAWATRDAAQRALIVRTGLIAIVALVGSVALFSGFFWEHIHQADDFRAFAAILGGDFGAGNEGSFAVRYRLLLQGLQDIARNPIWGIGPVSMREMLKVVLGDVVNRNGNYHNTYMNLTVSMGLPWALTWIGLHAVVIFRAGRALWSIEPDRGLAFGLMGACLVHFTILIFLVRIWSVDASAAYIVLMTIAFAAILRPCMMPDVPLSAEWGHVSGSETGRSRSESVS